MADRNEKVFERVRQELGKNGKLGSRQLYEMAKGWDSSIAGDTLQQFHARYVLPIKREESASSRAKGRGGRKAAGGGRQAAPSTASAPKPPSGRQRGGRRRKVEAGSDRERIRAVLLEFARDFAEAESRSDIVQVVSRVDDYVERIAPAES
jgi:hypothetical protein